MVDNVVKDLAGQWAQVVKGCIATKVNGRNGA